MSQIPIVVLVVVAVGACSRKPESTQSERHYSLKGRIVALNPQDRTATVDALAIPHFMEAMTMEYPVKSKADFDKLRVGDAITATVDVREDGFYDLSQVQRQSPGTAK